MIPLAVAQLAPGDLDMQVRDFALVRAIPALTEAGNFPQALRFVREIEGSMGALAMGTIALEIVECGFPAD